MIAPFDVAADVALRLAGASDADLDAVVTETLALLADHARADRTYVTMYLDDGTFENSHEWTDDGVVPQRPVIQQLRSEDFSYSYRMAVRNQVFAAPDLMALPDDAAAEKRSFASFGVKAVLQIPIVVNDEGVGLVGFNYFDTVDGWDDDLVEFARKVGQAIGVALVRERAARSIRRAFDEAERANRVKDELLAHVSHELRTPLHAMLGYAELLELDERSEQDRDALLQIQFNGRRLLTMVEDLIELAEHAGAGSAVDLSLAPVLESAIAELAPVAEARRIAIRATEVGDVVVHTEPGRLRQVVYCALSGALQAIADEGAIVAEAPPPPLAPSVRLRLTSSRPLPDTDVVVPLAHALIDGHGSIAIERVDAGEVEIVIRFADPTR